MFEKLNQNEYKIIVYFVGLANKKLLRLSSVLVIPAPARSRAGSTPKDIYVT